MNEKRELEYLRKVCEDARLCWVCNKFTPVRDPKNWRDIWLKGTCSIKGQEVFGNNKCNQPHIMKDCAWERKPQPYESKRCGSCDHFDIDYPPSDQCRGITEINDFGSEHKACKNWSDS